VTKLNVNLSQALKTQLAKPGIWAYATYFDKTHTTPVWTDLVVNGVVQNGGATAITLPTTVDSGKIYLLVQSQDTKQPDNLKSLITSQSAISWTNATKYDFRYDSFEVTLQNGATDAGNLSSVNGFGLPMKLSVPYSDGTSASGGYAISGSTLVTDLKNIKPSNTYAYTYTSGPLKDQFRMAVSPTTAVAKNSGVTNPPFKAADWTSYISSLEGPQASKIVLSGQFNGAPDGSGIWHNGGYFAYQLNWDSTSKVFWLDPLASSQVKGDIKLTPANLSNSIYSTLGAATVYTNKTDTSPYLNNMNTGANNQWGKVLSEFLTGFTGGFYGATGKSLNTQVATTVDLNQNLNWDPVYAFGKNLSSAKPNYQSNDPYSGVFYFNSNSYGSGYSDALMSQYTVGGPLISMTQPGSQPPMNVPNINLTLFADSETPAGYTVPKIYDYIPPTPSGYAVPATTPTPGVNVTLNLASAVAENAGVVLAKTGKFTLSVLTSDTGGVPKWSKVTFNGATAGKNGLWQNWNITYDSASKAYKAAPADPTAAGRPAGSILVDKFPTAQSGVSWYQIGVGPKTFNLYTTTSGGSFINPIKGQQGALAVDGLATITPQVSTNPSVPTFNINMAVGDTVTIDPSLLVPNTANVSGISFPVNPGAPVAGTITSGKFTAIAGQTDRATNKISTAKNQLAFGWTGDNNAAGTMGWISSYTNKIDALEIARVTIKPTTGTAINTMATADVDGKWQTGPVTLPNGSYTVTMREYLATDTTFKNPLTPVSSPLTLTVAAPVLGSAPPCFAAGTSIRTIDGDTKVEQLSVGCVVPTPAGRGDAVVVWIGHRTVDCRLHPDAESVTPIRVRCDAFAAGQPETDLVLSPDHAVFVDGVLIPVRYLVNGTTISREPAGVVTYYHVELDRHDIILAAGLPTESFLDTGNRSAFANGGAIEQMHPDFGLWAWEAQGCAPLVVTGPALARVRDRLQARAELGTPAKRSGGNDRKKRAAPASRQP
jgi:hypothetical protein